MVKNNENRKFKVIFIGVLVFFIITILFLSFISVRTKNKNKPSKVVENTVEIKDNYYKGKQYVFKKVYHYKDGSYCGYFECYKGKDIEEVLVIKSASKDAKELEGTDYSIGALFQDSNSVKLVDIKRNVMEKFKHLEGAKYKLLINDNALMGFVYCSSNESGYYSYYKKDVIYKNKYDEIWIYGNLLFSRKDNTIYILDIIEEKVLKEINDVSFTFEDIKSSKYIDDYLHIEVKDDYVKSKYFVVSLTDYNVNIISGNFDNLFLFDKEYYGIKENNISVYNVKGELVKEHRVNLGSKNRILGNYILTNINNNLTAVNMSDGSIDILIKNLGSKWFKDEEKNYINNEGKRVISLSIREDSSVVFPRDYDVIFDVQDKIFEVRKLDNY